MEKQGTNFGSFLKGLLIGSLIFGAVALFTAPYSGTETRQLIRDKGEQLRDKTVETIDIVREQVDRCNHRYPPTR